MPSRREFLRDVATAGGLLFVGCSGLADAAQLAPAAAPARHAPVILRGRKIRTIDIHAHCVVPQATTLLKRQVNRQPAHLLEGQAFADRLRDMDAQGIDIAVLSINPNWYDIDRDLATEVIKIQNDALSAFCASHADRFTAFATASLQFPDLAAVQLEDAVKKGGLRGVSVGGSVAGDELADPKFHPFFVKADELGVVVFIHPQPSPVLASRLKGNGPLSASVWNPIETTLALTHLIFEGTLDRFPGLKVCVAHGGGYLPSYMHRLDRGCQVNPDQCQPGVPKKRPTEYLKQLYYDSLVFTPEALRHLAAEVGADHIVMGTDYPFPWVTTPVDHVLETPGLGDAEREAILSGTATRLLGLRAASA
jgi:aminocarboxymuconate-semialdehyde decarboxylase